MKALKSSGIGLAALLLAATAAHAEELTLGADLTGAAEVPGPGDDSAGGAAEILLDTEKLRLCYTITTNVTEPTMVHIHKGAAGVAGPPVVTLDTPKDGISKNCADITKDVATAIAADPSSYYVNVHNGPFPAGAVRGQLTTD